MNIISHYKTIISRVEVSFFIKAFCQSAIIGVETLKSRNYFFLEMYQEIQKMPNGHDKMEAYFSFLFFCSRLMHTTLSQFGRPRTNKSTPPEQSGTKSPASLTSSSLTFLQWSNMILSQHQVWSLFVCFSNYLPQPVSKAIYGGQICQGFFWALFRKLRSRKNSKKFS